MVDLTPEQKRELDQPNYGRLRDPETNTTYILIPEDDYERVRDLLADDDGWVRDTYPAAMKVFAREGWDDPRMDVYDALDPRRES